MARRLPDASVRGRQVTLRAVKLVGRLLDTEGRATGYVPIDPWKGVAGPGAKPSYTDGRSASARRELR
jgi:hypothetical protein